MGEEKKKKDYRSCVQDCRSLVKTSKNEISSPCHFRGSIHSKRVQHFDGNHSRRVRTLMETILNVYGYLMETILNVYGTLMDTTLNVSGTLMEAGWYILFS